MSLTKIDDRGLKTPIDLQDDEKIRLGTGNDLELYHNGTNSYLDNSTGITFLRNTGSNGSQIQLLSNNGGIKIQGTTGEQSIIANSNGGVELYYNAVKKFETGTSVNINSNHFEITSGSQLRFDNSNNDRTSEILNTGSSGNSTISFKTNGGDRMLINESGNLGLGTTSPSTRLTVSDTGPAIVDIHHSDGSTDSEARIMLGALSANPPSNRGAGIAAVNNGSGHDLTIKTSPSHSLGPTEKMRIKSDGRVGIGKTPSSMLDIETTSNTNGFNLNCIGTPPNYFLNVRDDNSSIFYIKGSNGYVGVGTSSPSYHFDVMASSGDANMRLRSAGTGGSDDTVFRMQVAGTTQDNFIYFGDSDDSNAGQINYNHDSNYLRIFTNATERMRIDSLGRVAISTASVSHVNSGSTNAKYFDASDGCRLMSGRSSTSAREHLVFFNPNGDVGDITTSSSSTVFNTSSDYRLKENQVPMSDGITRLKTLKPYKFNWKIDPSTTVDGFFAHEVSTAVPEAVTGAKDATENCSNVVLDKDGKFLDKNVTQEQWEKGKAQEPADYPSDSTWSASYIKNVYQRIDHSKLVPLLTAALQEAVAKIEVLETKVAALEAA